MDPLGLQGTIERESLDKKRAEDGLDTNEEQRKKSEEHKKENPDGVTGLGKGARKTILDPILKNWETKTGKKAGKKLETAIDKEKNGAFHNWVKKRMIDTLSPQKKKKFKEEPLPEFNWDEVDGDIFGIEKDARMWQRKMDSEKARREYEASDTYKKEKVLKEFYREATTKIIKGTATNNEKKLWKKLDKKINNFTIFTDSALKKSFYKNLNTPSPEPNPTTNTPNTTSSQSKDTSK